MIDQSTHRPTAGATLPSNVDMFESATAVAPERIAAQRAAVANAQACPNCHRSWGNGRSCQFCRQVEGLPVGVKLASPGKRLGAMLLDGVLVLFTLFLGWTIWALVVYGRGQTPAKQLLGMRYVTLSTARRAGWGRTFMREFSKGLVRGIAAMTMIGLVAEFWLIWDRDNQQLWDKMVGTVVVDDPTNQVA
jgi:uncharacterized RDD family membrane protein YckC